METVTLKMLVPVSLEHCRTVFPLMLGNHQSTKRVLVKDRLACGCLAQGLCEKRRVRASGLAFFCGYQP